MSPVQQNATMIAVLCNILNGTSVTCTSTALATSAKCFVGIPPIQQGAIIIYLLCQISANGGGGGGGGQSNYAEDFGGVTPFETPNNGFPTAFDTSNGNLWQWDGSGWVGIILMG